MECLERAIEVYILEIELPLQVFQDMELQGDCFFIAARAKCAFHVGNGRKARKMASQNTDKQGVSDVVRVRCLCHFGDIGISLWRHRHVAGGDIGISPK